MSDLSFQDGSDFLFVPYTHSLFPLLFQFLLFIILFLYFYLLNHTFLPLNVKNTLKR